MRCRALVLILHLLCNSKGATTPPRHRRPPAPPPFSLSPAVEEEHESHRRLTPVFEAPSHAFVPTAPAPAPLLFPPPAPPAASASSSEAADTADYDDDDLFDLLMDVTSCGHML